MSASATESAARRLRFELDHAVKTINCEAIGAAVGQITADDVTFVAEMVASLRARYLGATLRLGAASRGECIDTEAALELKQLREAYQEAMQGFDALPLERQVELSGQVKTLTLPGEMGERFKCLALRKGSIPTPSAFQAADRTHTL